MRVLRLIILGLFAFVASVVWLFPAAPVIEKIKPQIQPVQLAGVTGKLFKGQVQQVSYNDDLMPLQAENVEWSFTPLKLFAAAAGVSFTFDAYGGQGSGDFAQYLGGDIAISDVNFQGPAKELEALLPLPVAEFSGNLTADIESVNIEGQILQSIEGDITWKSATLEAPISAFLGDVNLNIEPAGAANHRGVLQASGGDIEIEGTIELALNGDFKSDVLVTPTEKASPQLINAIRTIARPERDGRFRMLRNGNVNRLM